MALDYGTRRIGVALSDPLQLTANPHAVWDLREVDLDEELHRCVNEHEVERIVVGLPVGLSGREGPPAEGARRLAERVSAVTGLPVEMVVERFSTTIAESVLVEGGVRREKRRAVVDKLAAAVILQDHLDAKRRPERESEPS